MAKPKPKSKAELKGAVAPQQDGLFPRLQVDPAPFGKPNQVYSTLVTWRLAKRSGHDIIEPAAARAVFPALRELGAIALPRLSSAKAGSGKAKAKVDQKKYEEWWSDLSEKMPPEAFRGLADLLSQVAERRRQNAERERLIQEQGPQIHQFPQGGKVEEHAQNLVRQEYRDSEQSPDLLLSVSSDELLSSYLTSCGLDEDQKSKLIPQIKFVVASAFNNSANPSYASDLKLPDNPPAYAYKPRMDGGIVKYLEDNWAPFIAAGVMSRKDLRRIDPPAYQGLANWLSQGNKLPESLYLPTLKEVNDRTLRDVDLHSLSHKEHVRLAAARTRRNRQDREPQ